MRSRTGHAGNASQLACMFVFRRPSDPMSQTQIISWACTHFSLSSLPNMHAPCVPGIRVRARLPVQRAVVYELRTMNVRV